MDRVSRLAELRRKRQQGKTPEAVQTENIEKLENAQKLQNPEETPTEDVKALITDTSVEQEEYSNSAAPIFQVSENETVEAVAAKLQSELFQSISEQTGTFGEVQSHTKEKINYNSDLKQDLEPFLLRAQKGTENAINRLIQQRFREANESTAAT